MPKMPKGKTDTWADDQEAREYYYDDAHGYKEYIDEDEELSEQTENEKPTNEN